MTEPDKLRAKKELAACQTRADVSLDKGMILCYSVLEQIIHVAYIIHVGER